MQKLLFVVSLLLVAVSFGFNFWNQKTLSTMKNRGTETVIVREITAKDNRDSSYLATESLMRQTSVLIMSQSGVSYPGVVFTADGSIVAWVPVELTSPVDVRYNEKSVKADVVYQDSYANLALLRLQGATDTPTNTIIHPEDMANLREVRLVAPVASAFAALPRVVPGALGTYRSDTTVGAAQTSTSAEGVWEAYFPGAAGSYPGVVYSPVGDLVGLYLGTDNLGRMVDAKTLRTWWEANKDKKSTDTKFPEVTIGYTYTATGSITITTLPAKYLRVLRVGDIVEKVNATTLDAKNRFPALLRDSADKPVTLTVTRLGKTLDVVLPQ
jgi:S1-C subfamily serine protease